MRTLYGAVVHRLPIIEHGTRRGTEFIVVHDMESDNLDGVENYFRNGATADRVGAHLGIDGTILKPKVRQWADLDALVYHAVGGNPAGIGIELCGYASQSRRKWVLRRGQRIALAETIARLCHAYRLGEPRRGKNVLGHGDVSRRFNVAGGHTDPGPNFPWDATMKLAVKRYRRWYG
jgi:N-acetyl-anhydromuramyl-L-alanine amidase AmpD